jgi:survival-of-motor-neuron-related-splicing factor 30
MSREWDEPMMPAERERAKSSRQKRDELREIKKKKTEKKLARMQVIEQHREGEKQRWKDFTSKSLKTKGKPLSGKLKKSIFSVPDSTEGRVGIGTCNIGGKGMTDYNQPKSYLH